MKIKIPAQISLNITDEAFNRDVKSNSMKGSAQDFQESKNLIAIYEHSESNRKVYQMLDVESKGNKYVSALPSPTHLFLTSAIELFELSEYRKLKDFPECSTPMNESNLFLLNFEPGYTHECYTDYIKARISCIILLVSTIENFMNQVIPNDFIFEREEKSELKRYNKKKIERVISFKDKLEQVIPKAIKNEDFWTTRNIELSNILTLYQHRKEFIHLKTKSEDEWKRYSDVFRSMLDFDLLRAINTVISIINQIEDDFIEFEQVMD